MLKKLMFAIFYFLLLSACSNNESIINKAIQDLDYKIYLPEYLPPDLYLDKSTLTDQALALSYMNSDRTISIEIRQDGGMIWSYPYTHTILEYIKTGENPFGRIPNRSPLQIGDYIGVFETITDADTDTYMYKFLPVSIIYEIEFLRDLPPYYEITSFNLDEDEFIKVIESLK